MTIKSYLDVDVDIRKKSLETEAGKYFLNLMPEDLRDYFVMSFLYFIHPGLQLVKNHLVNHSEFFRLNLGRIASARACEILYKKDNGIGPLDKYFLMSNAGKQMFSRLQIFTSRIPLIILSRFGSEKILIDNVGSGAGHDMIEVLMENTNIKNRAHVRNIDIDAKMLKRGQKIVEELGIADCFSFFNLKVEEWKPKEKADLVLFMGMLCSKKFQESIRCLSFLKKRVCADNGFIVFSTTTEKMIQDDSLTDFIMREIGKWSLSPKTDLEVLEIARLAGFQVEGEFYEEPLRHHRITIARKI
ncbi:MAG: methyltransferase domain-containing protein [Candidatus Falkowbacteria bacterium]